MNAAGNPVRTYDLGALPQGVKDMAWDGKSDTGAAVADGAYQISITAKSGDKTVAANPMTYEQVISVGQSASGVSLELGNGGNANLSDVKRIL